MMFRLFMLVLLIFVLGCSEVTYLNPSLPDARALNLETIKTKLPLINIEVDQADFDYMYENFLDPIVIDAELSFYNKNREETFKNKRAKIEIKGATSIYFGLKSIGVTFDESLNNYSSEMIAPKKVLGKHSLEKITRIRLRNSGNDFTKTMIKDMAYTQLAIDADLDVELRYTGGPAQVFVNNNYLGLLNIRTESERVATADLLQVDTSSITLFRVDDKNGNLEYREGNQQYASELIRAIKNEDGTKLWEMIDVSNFIDYIVYQDYVGNIDWPHNNSRAYSVDGGRLRFILFDLDVVAYRTKNAKLPELEYVSEDIAKIYRGLRDVDRTAFDKRVKNRQEELYKIFSPERFNQIVDEMATGIEEEIPYQIAKYERPRDLLDWKQNLDLMKREFERRDYFMRKKYDIN